MHDIMDGRTVQKESKGNSTCLDSINLLSQAPPSSSFPTTPRPSEQHLWVSVLAEPRPKPAQGWGRGETPGQNVRSWSVI